MNTGKTTSTSSMYVRSSVHSKCNVLSSAYVGKVAILLSECQYILFGSTCLVSSEVHFSGKKDVVLLVMLNSSMPKDN